MCVIAFVALLVKRQNILKPNVPLLLTVELNSCLGRYQVSSDSLHTEMTVF